MSPLPPGGCPVPPTQGIASSIRRPSSGLSPDPPILRGSDGVDCPNTGLSSDRLPLRPLHLRWRTRLLPQEFPSVVRDIAQPVPLSILSAFFSVAPCIAVSVTSRLADGACGFEPMAKLVRAGTRYRRDAPGSRRSFFNVEWRQKPSWGQSSAQMRRFWFCWWKAGTSLCSAHLRMSSLALTGTHS